MLRDDKTIILKCSLILDFILTIYPVMFKGAVLTGVQLEEQLDGEVVEVTAVLDDLYERSQATLA